MPRILRAVNASSIKDAVGAHSFIHFFSLPFAIFLSVPFVLAIYTIYIEFP